MCAVVMCVGSQKAIRGGGPCCGRCRIQPSPAVQGRASVCVRACVQGKGVGVGVGLQLTGWCVSVCEWAAAVASLPRCCWGLRRQAGRQGYPVQRGWVGLPSQLGLGRPPWQCHAPH